MKTELLYELYEITEKNAAPDLATVGMAMLREKHPEITHEEAKEMREFTGRHGQELAAAYPADVRPMGGSWYEITFQGAFTYGN